MQLGKVLISRKCVVATEHPLASLSGFDAMRRGGNAFDAAVAASFSLSVLQPHLSGPGGDFFGLFYRADGGRVECINSSGWAPSSLSADRVRAMGRRAMPLRGPCSAVVPGHVAGVFEMHRRFGRLEFSGLLDHAISLALDGFPVSPGLSSALSSSGSSLPASARRVLLPAGRAPRTGEVLRQRELGRCLREIAEDGPGAFYSGDVSEAVREEMSGGGAEVPAEDLDSFRPEWREPLRASYRGSTVYEIPPNSMGATTLLMLRILEESEMGRLKPNSAERVRRTVEAARAAYSARDRELGDPRFIPFDLERFLQGGRGAGAGRSIPEADTTYFAVADGEGNLLSLVQSIFHHFGSRCFVGKYGFFLNNRGSAFRFEGPNRLEPRKRPLHTLSALLLAGDGGPSAAAGCSGGEYRPQQHVLMVTNMVDYSMELEEAIDYPRFLWDGSRSILVEDGYPALSGVKLKERKLGYPGRTGVAQGVALMEGAKKGVCDVRGDGLPMGE